MLTLMSCFGGDVIVTRVCPAVVMQSKSPAIYSTFADGSGAFVLGQLMSKLQQTLLVVLPQ